MVLQTFVVALNIFNDLHCVLLLLDTFSAAFHCVVVLACASVEAGVERAWSGRGAGVEGVLVLKMLDFLETQ